VGGKGASLARIAAAGLPVPPGFHITTAAYRRFVSEHGLQEQVLAAVSAAHPDQPVTLETAFSRIAPLFAQHAVPEDIAEAIRRAYAKLGAFAGLGEGDVPVAVRSSATAEDLPDASFAGQQETYLNVCGIEAVLDAVKRCWASLWTARAIAYRLRQDIPSESVALAVAVQRLVPAEAAGILFTANPMNGRRDEMVVNAAWGLGQAIVGGRVPPDTIIADKATGQIKQIEVADKTVLTVRTAQGTAEQPVEGSRRSERVLDEAQVAELVQMGRRIEALYGAPASEDGNTLVGVPVSPGVYEGTARIVDAPVGAQLERGEILVTHSTDPSWTPLFLNAGAVIMETGGPLSHGAIVAREYGIPAVVAVPEATSRLHTGQRLRVNGDAGEITFLA
jgi:phosphoenolpyruvate synthase/pyruvate phosphate dikinase